MIPKINYDKKLLGKLKSNYINAKALYETIKANAEEIQRKVLAENEFYKLDELLDDASENKRILDPDDTYMMDLDVEFKKYMALCYAEYVKAGIDDPRGMEYIPEANAKDVLHETENMLIDYGISLIPDEFKEKNTLYKAKRNIIYREKMLNIVLMLDSDPIKSYL